MEGQVWTLGGVTLKQREAWVETIFDRVKNVVGEFAGLQVTTCVSPCVTTLNNSYVRGQVFPFINIPIRYRSQELVGLYEYYGDQLPLVEEYIYCDIVVQSLYYAENLDQAGFKALEEKARRAFQDRNWEVVQFENGMATLTINRATLAGNIFEAVLRGILNQAVQLQTELS